MYEHMTDLARKVMQLANARASELNHEYIGGEHMLWGIIEAGGPAVTFLSALGASPNLVRERLQEVMHPDSQPARFTSPFSNPRAKRIIELARKESSGRQAQTDDVDLLVGVRIEGENTGALLLQDLGIAAEQIRAARDKVPVTILVQPGVSAHDIQLELEQLLRVAGTPDVCDALREGSQALLAFKAQAAIMKKFLH